MKKLTLLFPIILILLLISDGAFAQTDWEVWTTFNASGNVAEKLKFTIEGEDRYSHKSDDIKYFHYEIGLTYKISDKIGAGVFYREIYGSSNDISIRLPQPHLDFFWKEPIGFKFRTRLEYQMLSNSNVYLENQFRLRIRPGWSFKFWKNYNPFIQSEFFISEKYNLTRNRSSIGIAIKFGKIEIQPNYTLEMNNKDIWKDRHVAWINTKIKF